MREYRTRNGNAWVDCGCGCGTRFIPEIWGTRYFNEAHREDHHNRERRAARRVGKAERHPNTVLIWQLRDEMDAGGKEGLCIYCERRLPPLKTHICNDRDCQRAYNSDWKRGRRHNELLAEQREAG